MKTKQTDPPHEQHETGSHHQAALAKTLGITFRDPALLARALVHRSFLHEHPERVPDQLSNERLEFLGDAVLNMLTATWLYHTFADHSEGQLTTLRAALVKTATLARFGHQLNLGRYLRVSRGEETNAARERPSLLADSFEAVLGAIYLDQGIDAACRFLEPFLQQESERIKSGHIESDYRTRLQEQVQARQGITPTYRTVRVSGPDHRRTYTIEVLVENTQLGVGSGSNKQRAAQDAARVALERINDWQ